MANSDNTHSGYNIQTMNKNKLFPVIVLLFIFTLILTTKNLYQIITTTAPDFSDLWYSAKDLATDKNPYQNPNLLTGLGYPPNALLFFLPFTLFSFNPDPALFILLSFASILLCVFLSLKIVQNKLSWNQFFLATSLTLLSFPTKFTLGMGQNNAFALLFLLLAFLSYKQKRLALTGILLGTAIVIKAVLIFLLLFFFLKRNWKVVLYSLLVLTASIVVVSAISQTDTNLFVHYIKQEIPILLNLSGREIYYNQGILGFISRLSPSLLLRKYLGFAISLALVVYTTRITLKKNSQDPPLLSLFLIVLLLIDTRSWQHHFIWLIFPFIVLTLKALKLKNNLHLFLLGISYLLISWNFKNPQAFLSFPKSLLLSNTFYGTVMLLVLNIRVSQNKLKSKL